MAMRFAAAARWSLHRAPRLPVTYGYVGFVAALSITLSAIDPAAAAAFVERASTNLNNLAEGHFGTLIGSAFVTGGGSSDWILIPLLAGLLAAAERLGGGKRLIKVFAAGHIGATLLVALGLLIAVESGWMSVAVASAPDVGVSYGSAAVLGAMTALLPSRWRTTWAFSMLAAATGGAVAGHTFTSVGHLVALCIGLAIAPHLPAPLQASKPRMSLRLGAGVFVGAVFGLGIFGGDVEPSWFVPTIAVCAAAVAITATRYPPLPPLPLLRDMRAPATSPSRVR